MSPPLIRLFAVLDRNASFKVNEVHAILYQKQEYVKTITESMSHLIWYFLTLHITLVRHMREHVADVVTSRYSQTTFGFRGCKSATQIPVHVTLCSYHKRQICLQAMSVFMPYIGLSWPPLPWSLSIDPVHNNTGSVFSCVCHPTIAL